MNINLTNKPHKKIKALIKNNILLLVKEHSNLCSECNSINCSLKKYCDKEVLKKEEKVDDNNLFTCDIYNNGITKYIVKPKNNIQQLILNLSNKTIHKIAVVDDELFLQKDVILSKGFNEVISYSLIRKIQILEQIDTTLKYLSKRMDNKAKKSFIDKPCILVENDTVRKTLLNIENTNSQVINVLDIKSIFNTILSKLNYSNIYTCFLDFETFEKLPEIINKPNNFLSEFLCLDNKKTTYQSLIYTLFDCLNIKPKKDINIDNDDEVIILGNKFLRYKTKDLKIKVVKYSMDNKYNIIEQIDNSYDIMLLINNETHEMSKSFIQDVDINNIYKNVLKSPNTL